MKTKYLLLKIMLITQFLHAQILETEDFENGSYGRLTKNCYGQSEGQLNYKNLSYDVNSNQGDVDNFLINQVDSEHLNSYFSNVITLQQSFSYTWRDGLLQRWNTRTPGNNIIRVSFDLYTGEISNGSGNAIYVIYDPTVQKILTGISYNYSDGAIVGYYHYYSPDDNETKDRAIRLGEESFPTNTWLRLTVEYNMETGAVAWATPEGNFTPPSYETAGTAGIEPFQGVYYSWVIPNTPGVETVQNSAYDNVIIEASNNSLSSESMSIIKNTKINIYPNPTSDYINISSNEKIEEIQVFDMIGRNYGLKNKNNQIDIQSLLKGNYILTVKTEFGNQESFKFIKK